MLLSRIIVEVDIPGLTPFRLYRKYIMDRVAADKGKNVEPTKLIILYFTTSAIFILFCAISNILRFNAPRKSSTSLRNIKGNRNIQCKFVISTLKSSKSILNTKAIRIPIPIAYPNSFFTISFIMS